MEIETELSLMAFWQENSTHCHLYIMRRKCNMWRHFEKKYSVNDAVDRRYHGIQSLTGCTWQYMTTVILQLKSFLQNGITMCHRENYSCCYLATISPQSEKRHLCKSLRIYNNGSKQRHLRVENLPAWNENLSLKNKKKNLNNVRTEKVPFVDLAELLKKSQRTHFALFCFNCVNGNLGCYLHLNASVAFWLCSNVLTGRMDLFRRMSTHSHSYYKDS